MRYTLIFLNSGLCPVLPMGITIVEGDVLDNILPEDLNNGTMGQCLEVCIDHHGVNHSRRTSMIKGMHGSGEILLIPVSNQAAMAFANSLPGWQSRHVA